MDSIRKIFKIGFGPSSSHTMGPSKAALAFKVRFPDAAGYRATLYGSLAATGKGHLTDQTLRGVFSPSECEVVWEPETVLPFHPNGMKLEALDDKKVSIAEETVYSVGGGDIVYEGEIVQTHSIYPQNSMHEILEVLESTGQGFWEYVYESESEEIEPFLLKIWKTMLSCIKRGLENEGVLPGELHIPRKAASFFAKSKNSSGPIKHTNKIFSYALAVAEENAAGAEIVTAPTCGSAGVLPAVLYHLMQTYRISQSKILKGLATAGLIGNLVKNNASISGAEVGCQGEIGTACSMASGAAAQLLGGTPRQIEYAAEMGMEHHLGLTCDPVAGLVQIPCIERNAMAGVRAVDCAIYSLLSDGKHSITFDEVIETMNQTGRDMMSSYRETSQGGLAKIHSRHV
jgi:L-serine dehydratase